MDPRPAPGESGVPHGEAPWGFYTTREYQPAGTAIVFLDHAAWRQALGKRLPRPLEQRGLEAPDGVVSWYLEEDEPPEPCCGCQVLISTSRIRHHNDRWLIEETDLG